jgi:hypothetical protein
MKRWTPDHVRLANAVVHSRDVLRKLALTLDSEPKAAINHVVLVLNRALKARDDERTHSRTAL